LTAKYSAYVAIKPNEDTLKCFSSWKTAHSIRNRFCCRKTHKNHRSF